MSSELKERPWWSETDKGVEWTRNDGRVVSLEDRPRRGRMAVAWMLDGTELLRFFDEVAYRPDQTMLGVVLDWVDTHRPRPESTPNTPEPPPTPGDAEVWPLVLEDIAERDRMGRAKYGQPLSTHDGRDSLVDAYQEALDLVVYLRKAIAERDDWKARAMAAESDAAKWRELKDAADSKTLVVIPADQAEPLKRLLSRVLSPVVDPSLPDLTADLKAALQKVGRALPTGGDRVR